MYGVVVPFWRGSGAPGSLAKAASKRPVKCAANSRMRTETDQGTGRPRRPVGDREDDFGVRSPETLFESRLEERGDFVGSLPYARSPRRQDDRVVPVAHAPTASTVAMRSRMAGTIS